MIENNQSGPQVTPETLVSRITKGDKDAERQLIKQYWKNLFYIIQRKAVDRDLAQDITQETFIIVIEKARQNKIASPAALPSFIRHTGANLLIAHFRKEIRRKTDLDGEIEVQFPELAPSIVDEIGHEKIAQLVKDTIESMSNERDKDLLYRHFFYGQEKRHICDEYNLSPEHFDRVLYRARNRLKQSFKEKMNIDFSNGEFSHLFVVFLFIFINTLQLKEDINLKTLRDIGESSHCVDIATEDKPSFQQVSTQCQHKTRYL